MFPILFEFAGLKVYAYGLMIGLGILLGVTYIFRSGKREIGLTDPLVNKLLIYLVAAAVIGGKVLLFFEAPARYLAQPALLVSGNGFVFYGSLLFCFAVLHWFIKKNKLPYRHTLDLVAITTCIVHVFGRMGCFLAGCCYGSAHEGWLSVVYTNPASPAPLHCPLHPVQLYEVAGIATVFLILLIVKRNKQFQGQVFACYLLLYPLVRFVTEMFRGDEARGYLFNGLLSHSQFISVLIFAVGIYLYNRWRKQG
jgi:phosphatidylglycerol---prolipoprotein diacylglyceryl transferase